VGEEREIQELYKSFNILWKLAKKGRYWVWIMEGTAAKS
jgi:hypothetical protein